MKFNALIISENADKTFSRAFGERTIEEIGDNEVLINVKYSALNYKDALSASGNKGISRFYPHTPGIDASGIITQSKSADFKEGDEVLVTGYDLGMNTNGGFAEYVKVPAAWVVPLPKNLTLKESMIYGTAGFTAAIGVWEMIRHDVTPDKGKILVTGATGGVGSMAVAILNKLNYQVTASTGKLEQSDYLKNIGASEIISRNEVNITSPKPLFDKKWIGAIDNVGGNTLSTIIKSLDHRGVACVCGMVDSIDLNVNIFPFILRGAVVVGLDSASRSMELRKELWHNLANDWKIPNFDILHREVNLENIIPEIEKILQGGQIGKVLVKI